MAFLVLIFKRGGFYNHKLSRLKVHIQIVKKTILEICFTVLEQRSGTAVAFAVIVLVFVESNRFPSFE